MNNDATLPKVDLPIVEVDGTRIGRLIPDYKHPASCFFSKPKLQSIPDKKLKSTSTPKNNECEEIEGNEEKAPKSTNARNHVNSQPAMNKKTYKRTPIMMRQKAILNQWLFNHIRHPYPTAEEKEELAIQTGLTKNQVSVWFTNNRMRNVEVQSYVKRSQNPFQIELKL